MDIKTRLFEMKEESYGEFQRKLIPSVAPESIIGVRTPVLRKYAKELWKTEAEEEIQAFLQDLPHSYFEENQLHAFLLCEIQDYAKCISEVERFLSYVDNWATCDQLLPKVFKRNKQDLLQHIEVWLQSLEPYRMRYGVGMLMVHFLDEDFQIVYAEKVAAIRSEEYYVNMMIAWYFATALAKQYVTIIPFLEEKKLAQWTHNKAIQKAVESARISKEQKVYLKTLKMK